MRVRQRRQGRVRAIRAARRSAGWWACAVDRHRQRDGGVDVGGAVWLLEAPASAAVPGDGGVDVAVQVGVVGVDELPGGRRRRRGARRRGSCGRLIVGTRRRGCRAAPTPAPSGRRATGRRRPRRSRTGRRARRRTRRPRARRSSPVHVSTPTWRLLVDVDDGGGGAFAADVDADPYPLAAVKCVVAGAGLPGAGGQPRADGGCPLVAVVAAVRDLGDGFALLVERVRGDPRQTPSDAEFLIAANPHGCWLCGEWSVSGSNR